MAEIRIKRGATLALQLTFQADDGTPLDLTAVTLSAQVRTPAGDLVTGLPIVRTDVAGVATVTVNDTSQWPVGMLRSDLKALIAGAAVFSDTFAIHVSQAVTQ